MRHSARSWWLDEASPAVPERPLDRDLAADVVVVGGGYTGLWSAWHVLRQAPDARVVLLEADTCGHGPSGRNGGFLEDLWLSLPSLVARFGDAGALAVAHAAEASVDAIAAWCSQEGVDAWVRRGGHLVVSTAAAQDGAGDDAVREAERLGVGDRVVARSAADVQALCASPVFRAGTLLTRRATVQPARLALGLRARVVGRGASVFEGTRVAHVEDGGAAGVTVRTAAGHRVRAAHAVLAAGCSLVGLRPYAPRMTVGSSHIVLTEPVPDVLEALGWTSGVAITDARELLHYFRATADGRIAFGWAGGPLACGARLGGRVEVDPETVRRTRAQLVRVFPPLTGRAVTHAWGGPVDITPERVATIGSLPGGRVHHAYGYTGNGVGPSELAGRILASLALDRRDDLTRLPLVDPPPPRAIPPEPLRWAGGTAVLAAMRRREEAEERGGRTDPLTTAVAGLPRRLGITIGRGGRR